MCFLGHANCTIITLSPLATLCVKKHGTKPKFFKLQPVPFTLLGRVKAELDHLEHDGVLEKTYCEWATLVMAVSKRDNNIRLCSDYKVTVNPVLDIDQYPVLKPEDIFTPQAGGKLHRT